MLNKTINISSGSFKFSSRHISNQNGNTYKINSTTTITAAVRDKSQYNYLSNHWSY